MVKGRPVPLRFFVFLVGSAALSTTILTSTADSSRRSFSMLAEEPAVVQPEIEADRTGQATEMPAIKRALAAEGATEGSQERRLRLTAIPLVEVRDAPAVTGREEPRGEMPAAVAPLTVTVGKGDTLIKLLVANGVDRRDAHEAAAALRKLYDPRKLRVGQELALRLAADDGTAGQLTSLRLNLPLNYDLRVSRGREGGFEARKIEKSLAQDVRRVEGVIRGSFIGAARRAGLPSEIAHEVARIFSFSVDFQRDIQPNDRFEAVYEHMRSADGSYQTAGNLLYASLTLSGKEHRAYRFVSDGQVDYFDETGTSLRKALLRTPIDGARMSSGFGMRRHPILGYSKMHRGADFAAPTGTPILAAGDGVVEKVGWIGGYGNYVRIRHNSKFSTAYAHMSRFAKGMRVGTRVSQGATIGYVGSTGRSTGPHLHYEVLVAGNQVNPMGIEIPTGTRLAGSELRRFKNDIGGLETMIASLPLQNRLASRD